MNSYAEVVFWDVQHGNVAYIKSPNEKHIAIDLGTGSYGNRDSEFSPLFHLKHEWGGDQLNYLIITHPHKDHIDDILNFSRQPRVLLCPKYLPRQDIMEGIRDGDILLAPHHERENGYHNDLINLINPRLTIVSDGRFCDTSANSRYSEKSREWLVHRRNSENITRKCLTTNSDGAVFLRFGYDATREKFLYVTIN
jgi:beta-lactamase superfamily II metal-dependent hydrolase